MSERKDSDQEHKFSQWLERKTSEKAQQIKEADCLGDQMWQDRMTTANFIAHHVDVNQEEEVPPWDRGATFTSEKLAWWQWRGLPALSFAFSCFAIALVLFKVELVVEDQGIMLSFSGGQHAKQQKDVEQLIDQKLQSFASEQQVVLANYAADIKVKQQESNLQLASYVIGAARQERKEDITDFINYINQQRADEKFDQNMKFKQLEQEIKYRNTGLRFEKKSKDSQNIGLQSQPADWTTEE